MSIVVEVIDLACEQASQEFFIPQARLTSKSTTSYATLYGFSEFIASSPPKKYRKASVSGVAERIGFTAEETPRQCAGARYVWTGQSEYDLHGVLTQSYSKKLFAQCPKLYWTIIPLQINPSDLIQSPSPSPFPATFVGYCWPTDPLSCAVCDPNIVNWPLIGDVTTNQPQIDLAAFSHPTTAPTITSTSWSISAQRGGLIVIASPPHTSTFTGHTYPVTVGAQTVTFESVINDPLLAFPTELFNGVEGAYINWIDASNYSMILSEEYTDADALTNATIVIGTGNTAQTTPRTTGFTSIFTSVVFTITLSNLIAGKSYVVEVDMWEKGVGPLGPISAHTPKQYGFDATDTTHTITDVVATPAANRTITVQKPTITFAPLPT